MIKRPAPHGNIQPRKSGAGSREQCATTKKVKCVWLIAGCLILVSMFMNIMQPSNTIEIISGVDQNKQQQSKSLRATTPAPTESNEITEMNEPAKEEPAQEEPAEEEPAQEEPTPEEPTPEEAIPEVILVTPATCLR